MRAAQISELKQPPGPAELDGGGSVTIEAVALNPIDINVGNGAFYGGHPPLPYVPGCEAAGRTPEGELVYLFGDGRGIAKTGFLAERVDVPDDLPVRGCRRASTRLSRPSQASPASPDGCRSRGRRR